MVLGVFIRHIDAKLVVYELLFWKRGLSAVSDVTIGLSQEGKRSWKGSIGHCREFTSQHSEKKLEKWWWIRMWMAILKHEITEKFSKKPKKTT